mmetsp:Transcript_8673/g.23234  ORF Transcript_8673/g.23234 Transcript_8673/m.23234 type:complete len:252 (-) Transcript_8673:2060-2815(-)
MAAFWRSLSFSAMSCAFMSSMVSVVGAGAAASATASGAAAGKAATGAAALGGATPTDGAGDFLYDCFFTVCTGTFANSGGHSLTMHITWHGSKQTGWEWGNGMFFGCVAVDPAAGFGGSGAGTRTRSPVSTYFFRPLSSTSTKIVPGSQSCGADNVTWCPCSVLQLNAHTATCLSRRLVNWSVSCVQLTSDAFSSPEFSAGTERRTCTRWLVMSSASRPSCGTTSGIGLRSGKSRSGLPSIAFPSMAISSP